MADQGNSESAPLLPYASSMPLAAHGTAFRDGDALVVRDGTTLPCLCILCAASSDSLPLTLRFSWDSSFKVTHEKSTLELRKSGAVHAYLCQRHLQRWRIGRRAGMAGMIASLLLMLASIVLAVISEASNVPLHTPHALFGLVAGFAMFIVSLFIFTISTRTLSCVKIDGGYLWLTGCGEAFLAGLPTIPVKLPG